TGLPASVRGQKLEFFPEIPEVIEPAGAWTQAWKGDVWTASVPLSAYRAKSPTDFPLVVAAAGQGWRSEAKVVGAWPAVAAPAAAVSPALQQALNTPAAPPPTASTS